MYFRFVLPSAFLHCRPLEPPAGQQARETRQQRKAAFKPNNEPTDRATDQPTNRPASQPINQPTNQPFNQPANLPTNQSRQAKPTQTHSSQTQATLPSTPAWTSHLAAQQHHRHRQRSSGQPNEAQAEAHGRHTQASSNARGSWLLSKPIKPMGSHFGW